MSKTTVADGATPLPHIRGPEDFAAAFGVPRETVDKLQCYADLLARWQKVVNLVSPSTLGDIWHRHFADSAQLISLAPDAKCWVDLGSGGGFPGLVIAILLANHENQNINLIESNGRKCAFLSEVARSTGALVKVHEGRIEQIARDGRIGPADVVTSRALASLDRLLGLGHGFFEKQTVGLFLKGREAQAEIREAERHWKFDVRSMPSRTSGDGWIVEVKHLISQGGNSR